MKIRILMNVYFQKFFDIYKNFCYNVYVDEGNDMTKKQLKRLAQEIARCEIAVQNGSEEEVRVAKEKIVKLTESADLSFEEIVMCDELVVKILEEKNI